MMMSPPRKIAPSFKGTERQIEASRESGKGNTTSIDRDPDASRSGSRLGKKRGTVSAQRDAIMRSM